MKWVLHCFINTNMKCLVLYVRKKSIVRPLINTKVGHLQWASHSWKICVLFFLHIKCPISLLSSRQKLFQRHTLSTNKQTTRKKKNTQKDKEKREKTHQLSIWWTTSFVSSLSFFSHLLRWTESLSLSLFLSGMTASLKSPETPSFLSLSHSSSPPSSLWRIFSPNFMNYLQAFFLSSPPLLRSHLSLGANSTPASRQTLCLSVQPSVQLYLSGLKKKIEDETGGKMIHCWYVFKEKVRALTFVNEMQLWIERPHVVLTPPLVLPG